MANKVSFNCSILGPTVGRVFSVEVLQNEPVGQLKNAVKEKLKPRLGSVDVDIYMLWKPLAMDEILPTLGKIPAGGTPPGIELESLNQLHYFIQTPVSGKLHLVVRVPSAAISASSRVGQGASILPFNSAGLGAHKGPHRGQRTANRTEFHRKIWNNPSAHTTVFVSTQVTRNALELTDVDVPSQCCVMRSPYFYSSRNISGILIRNEYVQALKDIIAFCKGKEFAPNVDNFEGSDSEADMAGYLGPDGGMVMETAKSSVAPAPFPTSIINPFVDTEFPSRRQGCGVAISGSPGIGKSVLLDVILHLRTLAGYDTIFVRDQNSVDVYTSSGVFRMSSDDIAEFTLLPSAVWVLIDSNREITDVPYWVTDLGYFVVQAASPRLGKWVTKERRVGRYILKPWSLEEVLAARILQTLVPPSENELKVFFERHMPSAFVAYKFASSIQTYERDLVGQLSDLSLQDIRKILKKAALFEVDDDLPHRIFVIRPGQDRSQPIVQFTSQYWVDVVVSVIKKEKVAAAAQELFEVFSRFSYTECAIGWLLESVIGDIFAQGGVWNIREMEKSPRPGLKNCHWKIRASSTYNDKYLIIGLPKLPPVFISKYPFEDAVTQHIETHILGSTSTNNSVASCTGYYVPASQTEAIFDSFYYDARIKQATVLQLAVSNHHSMNIKGLERLKGLGVESICYVAVTGPQEDFDLSVPNEYADSEFLKGVYHLALNPLT